MFIFEKRHQNTYSLMRPGYNLTLQLCRERPGFCSKLTVPRHGHSHESKVNMGLNMYMYVWPKWLSFGTDLWSDYLLTLTRVDENIAQSSTLMHKYPCDGKFLFWWLPLLQRYIVISRSPWGTSHEVLRNEERIRVMEMAAISSFLKLVEYRIYMYICMHKTVCHCLEGKSRI